MIQRPGTLTIAQYEQMAEDGDFDRQSEHVELIRGELHFMSPAGPYHGDIVSYLIEWTVNEGQKCGYSVWPQQGVTMAELLSIPEPDVAWVKRRRYRRALPTVADIGLLIEVSHSSLAYDRNTKASLYAEAGIVEYWIANCDSQCIEVHRQPQSSGYAERFSVACGEKISPLAAPGVMLDVAAVFADE